MSKRESAPLPEAEADAKKLKTSDEAAQYARADNDNADDDDDDADDEESVSSTNLLISRLYNELLDGANSLVQCASDPACSHVSIRNARIALWEVGKMSRSLMDFKHEFEAEMNNSRRRERK